MFMTRNRVIVKVRVTIMHPWLSVMSARCAIPILFVCNYESIYLGGCVFGLVWFGLRLVVEWIRDLV